MQKEIAFKDLKNADLIVDCIYKGGSDAEKGVGNDPLSVLLQCGNLGGFRYRGSTKKLSFQFIVLTSSLNEPDWPDFLDDVSGQFVYYGDNRTPGHNLHDTKRKGNLILSKIFEDYHLGKRNKVPPIFIFTKAPLGRDVEFRGLAVPGAKGLSQVEDLTAIWKSNTGKRFQNYKSIFSILDISIIKRAWIEDLINGDTFSDNCPHTWKSWVDSGSIRPLTAQKTVQYRTKEQQLPNTKNELAMINEIRLHFKGNPHGFEKCSAELMRLMDTRVTEIDVTRPSRDGGRDAIGKYIIGLDGNSIEIDFALEAKLYSYDNSVGVKETSRLISRIRFRQFGIIFTTSFFGLQAYKEIIEDQHPIILVCANDIVRILKNAGFDTPQKVKLWLKENY